MNKLYNISLIEFKLLTRNFMSIFFALVFPVMMLLLFGSMYGNEPSDFYNGKGMIDASIPGYIAMIAAVTGLMSLPLTVALYRERKILKRFEASPINAVDVLFSQVIVNFILTVIGMGILIVVGKLVFDLHFFGQILPAMISFLLIVLSMFSLGLLIAGISPNGKAATTIAYLVYFPMLFLSGTIMPIEIMPQTVKNIASILPLTYGVHLFRGVWLGDSISNYSGDIIVLALFFVVCTAISIKAFKWE